MITDGKRSDEVKKWHYIALKSEPTDDRFNRPAKRLSKLFSGTRERTLSMQEGGSEGFTNFSKKFS